MHGYGVDYAERIIRCPEHPCKRYALRALELRISVAEVANLLGVSRIAVYGWFDGRRRPNTEHMAQLERYLG